MNDKFTRILLIGIILVSAGIVAKLVKDELDEIEKDEEDERKKKNMFSRFEDRANADIETLKRKFNQESKNVSQGTNKVSEKEVNENVGKSVQVKKPNGKEVSATTSKKPAAKKAPAKKTTATPAKKTVAKKPNTTAKNVNQDVSENMNKEVKE